MTVIQTYMAKKCSLICLHCLPVSLCCQVDSKPLLSVSSQEMSFSCFSSREARRWIVDEYRRKSIPLSQQHLGIIMSFWGAERLNHYRSSQGTAVLSSAHWSNTEAETGDAGGGILIFQAIIMSKYVKWRVWKSVKIITNKSKINMITEDKINPHRWMNQKVDRGPSYMR